jgi:hypothetical protein
MGDMSINWWAILVAVVAANVIGAVWFTPRLFGARWMREVGITEADAQQGSFPRMLALTVASSVVLAIALAWLNGVYRSASLADGVLVGLVTGIGVFLMASVPHYAFQMRTPMHFAIDMGHTVVVIVVMSAIIGLWR